MNKKIIYSISLIFCLLISWNSISADEYQPHIFDPNGLLSQTTIDDFNDYAKEIEDEYNLEVFFYISNNENEIIEDSAERYFEDHRTKEHAYIIAVDVYHDLYWYVCTGYMRDDELLDNLAYEFVNLYNSGITIDEIPMGFVSMLDVEVSYYLDVNGFNPNLVPDERTGLRFNDGANLVNDADEQELLSRLDFLSEKNNFDIVVVTVDDYDESSIQAFCDDYYDYNGFGQGPDRDGMILAISMADREFHIAGTGYGIEAFNDADLADLEYEFIDYLSSGDYYNAFLAFANSVDNHLNYSPEEEFNPEFSDYAYEIVGSSLMMGGVISGVYVFCLYRKLKSIHFEHGASNYEKRSERHIYRNYDRYLYSTVTRRRIERDNDSSSSRSSSGGSSSHRSSSGSSHSGRSGHF